MSLSMSHEPSALSSESLASSAFALLPPELHIEVFSHLDLIDSTCLGLTSMQFYTLHRRLHGSVALSTRRKGPNKLESVWKGYSAKGCSMCGTRRCELHMHVRSFIPERLEYCAIRDKFGPRGEGHESCYRSIPPEPMRCGRHPVPGQKRGVEMTTRLIESGRVIGCVA